MLRLACESSDNALQLSSLAGIRRIRRPGHRPAVIKAYSSMTDDVRAAAQSLLAARRASASQFLKGIENGTIDPESVSREIAEKLDAARRPRDHRAGHPLFGPVKARLECRAARQDRSAGLRHS